MDLQVKVCTDRNLNMITVVSARSSISKVEKSHKTVAECAGDRRESGASEPARMQKAKPVMVLVFYYRFHTVSSQKVCNTIRNCVLDGERDYGVGMFFFPQDELKRNQAKKIFEVIVEKEGLEFLGWRKVPVSVPKVLRHRRR